MPIELISASKTTVTISGADGLKRQAPINEDVGFAIDNPNIATIIKTGPNTVEVTGVAEGQAVLTAVAGALSETFDIVVGPTVAVTLAAEQSPVVAVE